MTNFAPFFQGPNITWRQLMCQVLGLQEDLFYDNLLEFIADRIGSQERMRAIVALGLTSDKPVEKMGSPLNTLSNHLAQVLNFGSDEKDLLLMRHAVGIRFSSVLYLKTNKKMRLIGCVSPA